MLDTESPVASGPVDLRLPAALPIEGVGDLKAMLAALRERPDRVVLDGAEVERVHTAALQLFCLFCRDRKAEGREVELVRPSQALRAAAQLLGTSDLLHLAGGAA